MSFIATYSLSLGT